VYKVKIKIIFSSLWQRSWWKQ